MQSRGMKAKELIIIRGIASASLICSTPLVLVLAIKFLDIT